MKLISCDILSDIPGANHCGMGRFSDEVFSSGKVHYAGQAIGLIVAETQELALKAAKMVKVTYKNHNKPILTLRGAIKKKDNLMHSDEEALGHSVVIGDFDPFKDDNLKDLEEGEEGNAIIKTMQRGFFLMTLRYYRARFDQEDRG